jgi:hypothetical protein
MHTKSNNISYFSNNQKTGLEFTWSTWLLIKNVGKTNNNSNYNHIFNKGTSIKNNNSTNSTNSTPTPSSTSNPDSGLASSNGPGLYITNDSSLFVVMDTTDGKKIEITVPKIPFNKWFHVAIRAENTILDIYINGTLTERSITNSVPKQNFQDIQICQNGGFQGQMSNLQYFNSALSVIQINNIVFWGPNLSQSNLPSYNTTDYLSPAWYFSGNNPPQI